MTTRDFHFELPEELIASRPLAERSASRMMVIHRESGEIEHRMFRDIQAYLRPDDLLVLNDTRVIPARFFSDDGKIELLFLDRLGANRWSCLVKPGKKMRQGKSVVVAGSTGIVVDIFENGDRLIEWDQEPDLNEVGHLALPHYMGRDDELEDRERYQTVYSKEEGAIAAPTAGLHFTPEILEGIRHAFLTLHVGVGTFRPVSAERPEEHDMHSERYVISSETARQVNEAGRVVAVGTTVTRVLESLAREGSPKLEVKDHRGETNIFIYPPYQYKAVDVLLTNFHLPESTLIMLVSAMAGRELVLKAYKEAVKEKYRFYSYGDCMLVI
ncbi:tRNA preQ1(34) S-adenosylmethionine ribosyltransferase-isomerase QueA [Haloferula sp.]|uniref:tRNA preQ1(34) S-adenosylmethionine ribosyltransferase-isomerase QueA n=1 Tax=Haloferula sp. TaxID=2497595 RepID=UPI003C75526D